MSWARIPAADGSGHCAVREMDAVLEVLSFEGTHARMTTCTESGSAGAWRLRIWLCPWAFGEELDIETHEPDAIFAVTTLYVLSEVGDEHAGWVRNTVLSALRRLARVQAGPLLYCSDDTLARLAAQAELRLRAEAAEAWSDLAHALVSVPMSLTAPASYDAFVEMLPDHPRKLNVTPSRPTKRAARGVSNGSGC